MMAHKVVFILLWVVFCASGCATFERWKGFPSAAAPEFAPPTAAATPPPSAFTTSATEPNSAAEPAEREPKAAQATSEPISPTPASPPRAELPPAQNGNDPFDLPAQPTPPSLHADNRLLELLEKDLDAAIEQQAESRRLQFSKSIVGHPLVRHFVDHYSTTAKRHFRPLLERSGRYMPMISKVLQQEGLPDELGYLALVESEFNVDVKSPSGAVGLWQFVAGTARSYGLRIDEWVDERRDPVKSTRAAAAYLKDLHDRYGRWYLATAAYNAGPGTISRAMKSSGAKDFWSLSERARLSEETRTFVPKFVAIALIGSDPQSYGFDEIEYAPPLDYEEVELPWSTTLKTLADWSDSDVATLRELNPALLRSATPPGERGFRANLPVGKADVYLAKVEEKLRDRNFEPFQVLTHEVRKGETLVAIARRYGQQVRALMEFNGLTHARLRIGQKIRILLNGIPSLR